MKSRRILLVHHAKNFESNLAYSSDNFFAANSMLFGAQEMDTWAGYRILNQFNVVYRLQVSPYLGRFQLTDGLNIVMEDSFYPNYLLKDKLQISYLSSMMKYGDSSIAINHCRKLQEVIDMIIRTLEIDLIWTETQFYDSLFPTGIRVITRSVNFEPWHVLREDPSLFKYVRYLSKRRSEKRIARNGSVIAISPRDSQLYARLVKREIPVLPLRQLSFVFRDNHNGMTNSPSKNFDFEFIYFAGSNFDVKHNRDNLKLILNDIAPMAQSNLPNLKILIFGHRFPRDLKFPANVQQMHFRQDFHSIALQSIGAIVPGEGGAGMQSKIFEPLCLGIPLIANRKAIAGYPYTVDKHFWNGNSAKSVYESLQSLRKKDDAVTAKIDRSRELSRTLFDFENVKRQMMSILEF